MRRITREELRETLKRFDIAFSERMLQHALTGIGLKPSFQGAVGRQGRVATYDPIDAWVLATAEYGREGTWTGESIRLEGVAELYDWVKDSEGAADVPGFIEDTALGMKLLYIARWQHGFPYEELMRCLTKDPELYELSEFDQSFMQTVLTAYKMTLGTTIAALTLPTADAIYVEDAETRRRYFAEQWVETAGGLFRAANTSAADYPEGGEA